MNTYTLIALAIGSIVLTIIGIYSPGKRMVSAYFRNYRFALPIFFTWALVGLLIFIYFPRRSSFITFGFIIWGLIGVFVIQFTMRAFNIEPVPLSIGYVPEYVL